MKRAAFLVASFMLATLLLVSNTPLLSAEVYAGTERDDRGDAWPELRIWLVINTDTQKLEFKWDSPSVLLLAIPAEFVEIVWMVWDDEGFGYGGVSMYAGLDSITLDYNHTYTWSYAEAWWVYKAMGSGAPIFFHAKIYLYVGGSSIIGGCRCRAYPCPY